MPRNSFKTRRGKPRISYQQNNAILGKRNTNKKKSGISLIEPDYTKQDDNQNEPQSIRKSDKNKVPLDEQQRNERMWKMDKVSEDNPIAAPLIKSSFDTRYPQHRDGYIRLCENKFRKLCKRYGLALKIDYKKYFITVSTTNRTWDPYSVIKARDLSRLIARYVPFEHAAKVMQDEVFSDVIEIGKTSVSKNQLRFIKRRARIIGPNGVTLRAIELLTKCYVLVYGRTVAVIGDVKGIRRVRKIVMDCMNNIHPIYQLKRLMVEKELEANPELNKETWDRFLPTFKKMKRNNSNSNAFGGHKHAMNNQNRRGSANSLTLNEIKKRKKRKKRNKRYTPWPPAPIPSKIDIAMETGAYWNKQWRHDNLRRMDSEQKFKKMKMNEEQQHKRKYQSVKQIRKSMKQEMKAARFRPPSEISTNFVKKRLLSRRSSGANSNQQSFVNLRNMKRNINKIDTSSHTGNDNDVNRFLLE